MRSPHSLRTLIPVRLCAGAVALIGVAVLLGWGLQIEALKSIVSSWVTMKANTAFGFVLCGSSLWLGVSSSPRERRVASVLAFVALLIGLLTLVEYFSGWRMGLDEWLFRDFSRPTNDSLQARMSPASAFCFLIGGFALFVSSAPRRRRSADSFVAATGASLAAVGFVGMVGYVVDGLFNVRWWNYTGLAIHTAVAFCVLGIGILAVVLREGEMGWALDRSTTRGFAAGVITLLVSAGISYHYTSQFGEALGWVSHTQEVLKEIERVEATIVELQAAQRAYILTGSASLRDQFNDAKRTLPSRIDNVYALTGDNPQQQRNVIEIRPAIEAQVNWAENTMNTYDQQGPAAATKMIASGSGLPLGRAVRVRLSQMRTEEYRLLGARQDETALASKDTYLVLPLGTIVSLVLLALGIFFLNAGAQERARYQRELEDSYRAIQGMKAVLEDRVVERTAELEATNRELEAFSYTVSHDLRAPLRAVDGYSQAVIDDFGSSLPAEGARQLRVIRSSAQHMGHLIDDLLMFSRLGRQELARTHTATADVVRAALKDVELEQKGRDVRIDVGPLPMVDCDPVLLRQVWVNLLSNAVKYTAKREHAKIEVGSRRENGGDVFFVRDNGTGFDMRYVNKLFGVFQRLHNSEDFEGTGVGLAIVHRIITRHGGRIWAEGIVDQGATFTFTLPAAPAAA